MEVVMRVKKMAVICTFALLYIGNSKAQNLQCPDIARLVQTHKISLSSSSFLDTTFSKYCYENGSKKSGGGGLGIDAVINSIPVRFTGNYNSSDEGHTNFCKTYKSNLEGKSADQIYEQTIAESGYKTIDQCLILQGAGVQMAHDITNHEALSFYMRSSVVASFELQGVRTSGPVKCSGIVNGKLTNFDAGLSIPIRATQAFACKRIGVLNKQKALNFDEATVTILTNHGNYPILWPKNQRESEDMAVAIQKRISAINAEISTTTALLRTVTAPTAIQVYKCPLGWMDDIPGPNLAWASYGCTGQISTESTCSDRGWGGGRGVVNEMPCTRLGAIRPYD
jgi:hypothetical protein